ncbi:MAG: DHHA1 domain-containing protein, partial [Candidatus Helarchaeales archaeon]
TGNEENCLRFLLSDVKIPLKNGSRHRTISDLSKDEKRILTTKLIEYGLSKGLESEMMRSLVGYVYDFPLEKALYMTNAADLSSLLNSCGREDLAGAGLAICIGDRSKNHEEAVNKLQFYKKELREGLQWIENTNAVIQKENLQYYKANKQIHEKLVGEITSLLISSSLIDRNKPVIGISTSDDGTCKISARAKTDLTRRNLHLGDAIREAIAKLNLNTSGGGHDAAAGGRVPSSSIDEFINILDVVIKKQLNSS